MYLFYCLKNEKCVGEEKRRYEMVNSDSRIANFLGKCGRIAG